MLPRLASFCLVSSGTLFAQGPVLHWSAGGKPRDFSRAEEVVLVEAAGRLDGAKGASLEAWVFPRGAGEQTFAGRGLPTIGTGGERFFRRTESWTNYFVGTDAHGFLMGCINGNSRMPFPLVTLEMLQPGEWHQVVVVKQANGFQRFHHDGIMVHTDEFAEAGGQAWPFVDKEPGEPLRLSVPFGGSLGEVSLWARELSGDEIRANWESHRAQYIPHGSAHPSNMVRMHEHPPERPLAEDDALWKKESPRILAEWKHLLGSDPEGIPPLDPQELGETDCGGYVRRKVSIQVQPGDRMPCWLLVPKLLPSSGRTAAIICFYGITSGAGKDTTVGLSGAKPGSPAVRNRAFAIDMVDAGFVALAPDFLRDDERLPPSGHPYDTTDFYERFPDWSCVGKDCWDVRRAVDYLQTLPYVADDRIGMVGHSYGGHTTIFATGLEPRIRAAFSSGPVSDFVLHEMHWAVPKGAANSQSLPSMRPYLLEHRPPPVSFAEVTALIAPRPLWVNQAVGEHRPNEEENAGTVGGVYRTLGNSDHIRYTWCPGDHDFPPAVRAAAVEWFRRWLGTP